MRKRLMHLCFATFAASAVIGAAQAAFAAPVDLTCPSAATLTFSPGVALGAQTISIGGTDALGTSASALTPCTSALTGVPYTGGIGRFSGTGTFGCASVGLAGLTGSASGTVAVTWNNGDTSTIAWSLTVAGPVPTVTATVASGALRGSTVLVLPVPTGFTGNCIFAPITSISFGAATIFVQL